MACAIEDERLTDSDLSDEERAVEQPEEEEPVTPRPVYSDEELHQLVDYIQRMTSLYALNQRDWNEINLDIIRRWLLEVNQPLLTICYGQDKLLNACLGFPVHHVVDLSYFRRNEPNMIFRVDGFHDEINFGTIHSDVDGCLSSVLENIYMPFFRNFNDWNSNVRWRFCSSLDRFLAFLTGVHCKIGGMTVLYVPYVMKQLVGGPGEECKATVMPDRQLVKCLEAIAVYWSTQVRTLLGDRSLTVPQDLTTVRDEFEFWEYRYEVLQGINSQLSHPDLRRILKILRQSHSVHIPQIDNLIESAKLELLQSLSNIKYLHLLIEACSKIDLAPSPNDLPKLLPRIIHLIRFIWLNSEYYNSNELITGLFRNLSNQIINYCTEKTRIKDILSGQPRFGLKICHLSIDCCLIYRRIFDEMTNLSWKLDVGVIFNHIDSFMERLNDVCDICESMIVFGRLDEFDVIPKPQFGGSRGEELAKTADAVEQQFLLILKQLQNSEGSNRSPSTILNVHCEGWHDQVAKYRRSIQHLEETIQRLIFNVFQRVCNVEEALEALQTMIYYSYRQRGTLRKTYLRQVTLVWQMFSDEMDFTVRRLLEQSHQEESWLFSKYVSRAVNYRVNLERLCWLRERLKNAEWLPVVKEAVATMSKFDSLEKEFNRAVRQSYDDWKNSSSTYISDLSHRLERYLLTKLKTKCLLQCNIDPVILELCDQAQHFERFGFVIPTQLKKTYERADYLRWLYNSLQILCLNYNHVILLLTEKERKLFRPLIQECDRQLGPCLFKLTFNSELAEDFFEDSSDYIENLRDVVYIYKRANREIKKICEKICDLCMLEINFKGAVDISLFEQQLLTGLNRANDSLNEYYNHIVELLFSVNRQFQGMREEMSLEWSSYINILDDMLAMAFMTCSRSSLCKLFDLLHCDPNMAPASVLVMESDIKDGDIIFNPSMSDIGNLFNGIIDRIQNIIDQFPRLGCKLKLSKDQQRHGFGKVFREDQECVDLVHGIIKGAINRQHDEIVNYVSKWNQHCELWKTSESKFIEVLKASAKTAEIFEGKIKHYSSWADDISFVDAIINVNFILINQNALKSSILDWIEKWQVLNIQILLEHSSKWIRAVYRYMRRNEMQVMKVPRTQWESVQAKAFYERLVKDVHIKQASFTPLLDLFVLLHKYQVKLSEKTHQQVSGLETNWLHYLQTLMEADEMLDMETDEFKLELAKQMDKFKVILKEFLEDYYTKVPQK